MAFTKACFLLLLLTLFECGEAGGGKGSKCKSESGSGGFAGDDFSNNLASDIAPLLALFGERFTQQYLTASFSIWDHILFAMAPLGIITAFVSVVRVAGANWLKVLVGRATENLVQAELELMSSTSNESCDLWNGRAIVRTLGRPKVSEIIYAPKNEEDISPKAFITVDPSTQEDDYKLESPESIGTSERSLSENTTPYWKRLFTAGRKTSDVEASTKRCPGSDQGIASSDGTRNLPEVYELPPNISLNTYGRSSTMELVCMCVAGALAQAGALVWCGVVTFREDFTQKYCILDSAFLKVPGFWMYLAGTLGLAICIGLSAGIIDGSTSELHWTRKVPPATAKLLSPQTKPIDLASSNGTDSKNSAPSESSTEAPHAVKSQPEKLDTKIDSQTRNTGPEILASTPTTTPTPQINCSRDEEKSQFSAKNMRLLWIQREHTTADQNFESVILMGERPRQVVQKSHRVLKPNANQSSGQKGHRGADDEVGETRRGISSWLHWPTWLVVGAGIVSFIVQFQGLRFSNWSCTVAQLIAVGITTILRAIVRRGMRTGPIPRSVPDGYHLDDLSLRITENGPDFVKKDNFSKSSILSFEFTDGEPMDAIPANLQRNPGTAGESLDASHLQNAAILPLNDQAHRVLKLRERLGRITKWQGPKFNEAILLANSIEAAVNALEPDLEDLVIIPLKVEFRKSDNPTEYSLQNIGFTLTKVPKSENEGELEKKWKVNTAEIEAALSLATFCMISAEVESQERDRADTGARGRHRLKDNDWLRAVDQKDGKAYTLVVASSDPYRECLWWIGDPKAPYASQDLSHETHAGFSSQEPRLGFRSKQKHSEYLTLKGHGSSSAAIQIFSAFIWAISKHIHRIQPAECQIREMWGVLVPPPHSEYLLSSLLTHDYNPEAWRPHLRSARTDSVVEQINRIGLLDTSVVQKAMLEPLRHADKIPNETFVDFISKPFLKAESDLEDWALYCFPVWLMEFVRKRNKLDSLASRAAAIVAEFLLRRLEEPFPQSYVAKTDEGCLEGTIMVLKTIFARSEVALRAMTSLEPLYKQQLRLESFQNIQKRLCFHENVVPESTSPKSLAGFYEFQGETDVLGWTEHSYGALKKVPGVDAINAMKLSDVQSFLKRDAKDTVIQTILDTYILAHQKDFVYWMWDHSLGNLLADYGVRGPQQQTLLHRMALAGNLNSTKWLLHTDKVKLDQVDYAGRTALSLAAWHGHDDIVSALVKKGADTQTADKWGATALHFASLQGHDKTVEVMIEEGKVALTPRDDDERTPLYYACLKSRVQVVKILLKAFAKRKVGRLEIIKQMLTEIEDAAGLEEYERICELVDKYSPELYGLKDSEHDQTDLVSPHVST